MKKTILTTLMALMAMATMAQPHLISAYKALKQGKRATVQRISTSYDDDNKCTGQLEIYTFDTSRSPQAEQPVRDLIEAFNTDSGLAYSYINVTCDKDAATQCAQRYAINYDDAGNTVIIGKDKKCNYIMFSMMDKDDNTNTMRYCYAIEWQEHPGDGHLSGRVIKAYAPKPKQSRKPYVVRVGGKEWSGNNLNDLDPATIQSMQVVKGDPDSVMIELRDLIPDSLEDRLKELHVKLDGLGVDLSESLSGLENGLEGLKGLDGNRVTVKMIGRNDHDSDPTDDVEWITSFNHYRNAFKRAARNKSSSVTSYATSILRLCKNAQKASLTDGEVKLCRKSIIELQKLTEDDFIKGLLDEAINYLK